MNFPFLSGSLDVLEVAGVGSMYCTSLGLEV